MTMSRRHYQQVAEVIQAAYTEHLDSELSVSYAQGYVLQGVASQLAWMFSQDNPRFDRNKFLEACFPNITVE